MVVGEGGGPAAGGLRGAVLLDLILAGRLSLSPDKRPRVTVLDASPTGHAALNDPSRHTRETHSDALATTLRTRRTHPSRPPPRPSRSTSSKPPLNNIPGAWCSLTG